MTDYQPEPTTTTTTPPRSELSSPMVSSFTATRLHRLHQKPVSCLSYSLDGTLLLSSSGDDTVIVYNATTGIQRSHINLHKYGAALSRFAADTRSTLIVASNNIDNKIRALDVEYERYIRCFDAHDTQVVSLSTSPAGPHFLSTSRDSLINLWDCRAIRPKARVRATGTALPIVAYDPKGLIFGVANNTPANKTAVKLYDARQYSDGPFLEFPIDNISDAPPTTLKFSSDGEYFLLVNADVNPSISVYDAYKGGLFRAFRGHSNTSAIALEADFSPDSAYVASGSDDGSLYIWNLSQDCVLVNKHKFHALPSACVAWNPLYAQLASACQNVALWMPKHNHPRHEAY